MKKKSPTQILRCPALRLLAFLGGLFTFIVFIAQHGHAQEWAQLVAETKKEGRVVVAEVTGATARKVLKDEFEAKFSQIHVEYSGLTGREIGPRILAERRAGKKLWDVYIGGPNTPISVFKPIGALLNLHPAFVLSDVKENRYWHDGLDFGFTDHERRYVYAYTANIRPPVWVNQTGIPSREFSHPRQFLDPKFRGKIAMNDPRAAGSGVADLAALMTAYGEDFIRRFLTEQGLVFTRNLRQLAEWVVRGRYPIALGTSESNLADFRAQGLGKDIEWVTAPEVETWKSASGNVTLVEGGPHPYAARVYLNWLLSKNTQELWSQAIGYNSRRTDVPPVAPEIFPKTERLKQYIRNDEAWDKTREKAMQIAKNLIK
jgi:iron(III) transport system substrate-binding protein